MRRAYTPVPVGTLMLNRCQLNSHIIKLHCSSSWRTKTYLLHYHHVQWSNHKDSGSIHLSIPHFSGWNCSMYNNPGTHHHIHLFLLLSDLHPTTNHYMTCYYITYTLGDPTCPHSSTQTTTPTATTQNPSTRKEEPNSRPKWFILDWLRCYARAELCWQNYVEAEPCWQSKVHGSSSFECSCTPMYIYTPPSWVGILSFNLLGFRSGGLILFVLVLVI
jgi:hypothetical protein